MIEITTERLILGWRKDFVDADGHRQVVFSKRGSVSPLR
jgi:hypothetical protein